MQFWLYLANKFIHLLFILFVQYLPLQIAELPRPRYGHCAAAFIISSELTEVVLFGGVDQRNRFLSDTTILLRIGEFTDFYKIIYCIAEVCWYIWSSVLWILSHFNLSCIFFSRPLFTLIKLFWSLHKEYTISFSYFITFYIFLMSSCYQIIKNSWC